MPEQYTNIAGGPFQSYVAKQIEVRKNFLLNSHKERTNSHLLYQNNRNAWIRLTSSVNVLPDHKLAKKYNLSGDALAKKYILQGGTIYKGGLTAFNRGGVGENKVYGMLPERPLGFKPMPGITSIDLSSAGRLGTLQYATIKFICYDLEQLELFDALYMKLGFSMVLEWGHTYYLDNEGNLKDKPIPLDVFSHNTKENLIKAIQRKRISHAGNYDAMLGTVSNFSWDIQKDGTYICEIKLVGAGDILESLKINQSVTKNTNFIPPAQKTLFESDLIGINDEEKEQLSSTVGDRDLSLLNRALFNISQYHMHKPDNNGVMINGIKEEGYRNILNKIFSNCPYQFLKFNEFGDIEGDENAKKGNHYSLLSGLNEQNGGNTVDIPYISPTLFNVYKITYNINGNSPDISVLGLQPQVYITLGNLLCLLTATGMIYTSDSPSSNAKPYIYVDFNDHLNFCSTYKGQLSLDPNICLIPRNQNENEDPFGLGLIEDKLFKIINKDNLSLKNEYLNTPNNEVRARLMHIMININHITNILRTLRGNNPKGNVSYSDFLNALLDDVSKSLGGFNEFRIVIDDSSKTFRIVDDNRTTTFLESDNIDQYTELPLFGVNSLVYDYNFRSKIGPNMASMITIAAQAEPSTLGEDAFAISNLSRGLEDRLMKYKRTSDEGKIVETPQQENTADNISEDNIKTLKEHLSNILTGDGNGWVINSTLIEPSYNTYKELLAKYRIQKDPNSKGNVLIPLDFNITLDGISGIIPNSAFTIPTNLLPTSYLTKDGKSKVAFILHTINQNFDNNKWTTKITGQTLNIRFDKEDKIETPIPIVQTNVFGEPDVFVSPTFPISQTCTRRASAFLNNPPVNIPIGYLKQAANEIGLNSPQAIASLIAISAGESGLNPRDEGHIYKDPLSAFPGLSPNQVKRLKTPGISKKEAFNIIYGEYKPERVGNRNISDGGKYYGRGYIQLTGYGNYKRYAQLSGIDIVKNPELVNHLIYGAKIAAVYFKDRVKVDQYNKDYFKYALKAVGNQVRDSYQKKTEYYNCYINRI